MRNLKLAIVISLCFVATSVSAQNSEGTIGKYHPFSIYLGVGPSYFFNNLVQSKDDVNSFQYAANLKFMWAPKSSNVSLGIETGYYKLYTVNSTSPKADVSNAAIPIMFVVSMRFGPKWYADFSMGQSFTTSKVTNTDSAYNFNSTTSSLSDFSATVGYHILNKERINYSVEFKGFLSTKYDNQTIALLFLVGFKL